MARQVEACSPVEAPTECLAADVAGAWRLLYTTVRARAACMDCCLRTPPVWPGAVSLFRRPLTPLTPVTRAQITIRGGTRTKLGLRGALTLGELQQVITCDAGGPGGCGDAVNTVAFSLAGMAQGSFTVDARYTVASPTRRVAPAGMGLPAVLHALPG